MYTFDREAYEKRMAWYTGARFGMFIHWGLYAIPARGEWVRSDERIKKEDYMPSACSTASTRISSPPTPSAAGTWCGNF